MWHFNSTYVQGTQAWTIHKQCASKTEALEDGYKEEKEGYYDRGKIWSIKTTGI